MSASKHCVEAARSHSDAGFPRNVLPHHHVACVLICSGSHRHPPTVGTFNFTTVAGSLRQQSGEARYVCVSGEGREAAELNYAPRSELLAHAHSYSLPSPTLIKC